MPRKASTEIRLTLYRLIDVSDFDSAIKEKYLGEFKPESVSVGGRDAILFLGTTTEKDVGWRNTLIGLSGKSFEMKNAVPAAVLLIPDVDHGAAWAITFGMGFQLLDQRYVDSGFGQRVAIRCVDPTKLNSITKVTLDEHSKTERSSIPAGASLRNFGFEDIGELVTRLVASGKIDGIGNPDKSVTIRGADALSLPLSKNPNGLLLDLARVEATLDLPPTHEDLKFLEKLTLIKNSNIELLESLDDNLVEAISDSQPQRLGLAWPHETVEEFGTPQKYRLTGTYERHLRDGLPTLVDLLKPVRAVPKAERAKRLESLAVILFENDEQLASGKLPLKKWLSYETILGGVRYFLHSGRWYSVQEDYAATVHERTLEIFGRPSPIPEPPTWTSGYKNELAYNKDFAAEIGGLVLDQKLIQGDTRRGKIEACDVLLKDGTFIHVKHTDSSAPASHLLAQALVSTEILTYDETAKKSLAARIKQLHGDPADYTLSPKRVVIVMAREGRLLGPEDLYTFTKVNLGRQDRALASRHVDVFVVPILKEKKQDADDPDSPQ